MDVEITDYLVVSERAESLGFVAPEGLTLLPVNFDTAKSYEEFVFRSEAATLRTLFRNSDLDVERLLPAGAKPSYLTNKSFEWTAPTLFVAASLWSDNASAINIALGLITNYLTDYFKGIGGSHKVKVSFVVEKTGSRICKKLSCEGTVEGLSTLASSIKALADE
jgi:hypothetical protein